MITPREFTALRAALLYWREEMCPHPESLAMPYLDTLQFAPLSAEEVNVLRNALTPARLRYVAFHLGTRRLMNNRLVLPTELSEAGEEAPWATVVLPSD